MKSITKKPNLRSQQRANIVRDIAIEKPDGCQLTCKISNLSRAGVMVSCTRDAASLLIPRLQTPSPGDWIAVKTRFLVPVVTTQSVPIAAGGNIIHLRRVARDEFQLGIQFSAFEGNGFDYVDQYVRKLLAHSP